MMPRFQIGLRVPPAGSIQDIVGVVKQAEQAGIDMAWLPDSPLNYREIWSTLGAIAVSTSRISFGTAITNFASRHLTVTASAARTISEAVPGRFTLGVGAGDSGVGYDNLRSATVAGMEEGIRTLKTLLSGGSIQYGSFAAQLRGAGSGEPPIYLAASGPRTLRLGGSLADGVIIPMSDIDAKLAMISEGARAAGRPVPRIYVLAMGGEVLDAQETRLRMKVFCARLAQTEGVGWVERAGFKVDGDFLAHKMGADGDFGHAANVADAGRALDDVISNELADWYMLNNTLIGNETQIEDGLEGLAKRGIAGAYIVEQENSLLPYRLIKALAPLARKFESREVLPIG
jgi:5,10-methylenetetrahydromethanopterin reductase